MPQAKLHQSKNVYLPCVEANQATCANYGKLVNSTSQLSTISTGTLPYVRAISDGSPKEISWNPLRVLATGDKQPRARSNFASCSDGDNLYVQGGIGNNMSFRDFWKFDRKSSRWTEIIPNFTVSSVPKLPLLRDHCMVYYKQQLFIIGGNLVDTDTLVPVWCFDLQSLSLISINVPSPSNTCFVPPDAKKSNKSKHSVTLPSNLTSHSAVLFNGSIFIYGGFKHIYGCSGEFWAIHVESRQWRLLYVGSNAGGRKGPPPLYEHKAVVYANQMFVFFGRKSTGSCNNEMWAFNFDSNCWRKIAQLGSIPPYLLGVAVEVVGSSLLVVGGKLDSGEANLNVYLFSFASKRWTKKDNQCSKTVLCGSSMISVPCRSPDVAIKSSPVDVKNDDPDSKFPDSVCGLRTKSSEHISTLLFNNSVITAVDFDLNLSLTSYSIPSVDYIPKKKTIFFNPMFVPNSQDSAVSNDKLSTGSQHSSDRKGLSSKFSFSKSVPRLDKLDSEGYNFDLRSSESSKFMSMDSLSPLLYSGEPTAEERLIGQKTNRFDKSCHCYVNESYSTDCVDNPLLNSQLSTTSNCSLDGPCVYLIGGFDDNFMPGSKTCLDIFVCSFPKAIESPGCVSTVTRSETCF